MKGVEKKPSNRKKDLKKVQDNAILPLTIKLWHKDMKNNTYKSEGKKKKKVRYWVTNYIVLWWRKSRDKIYQNLQTNAKINYS